MLARAKAKTEAADHTNVEFVAAALGDGKLPANHFDRVVLATVLGEIPNGAAALAELFSALKPGGILAIVEVIFDPHFQSRSTVTSLAISTGFRERAFFGRSWAYVIHFERPNGSNLSFARTSEKLRNMGPIPNAVADRRGLRRLAHKLSYRASRLCQRKNRICS
jgi:ubiquinone/menaquinone biosynthesis C-methylase UbiE